MTGNTPNNSKDYAIFTQAQKAAYDLRQRSDALYQAIREHDWLTTIPTEGLPFLLAEPTTAALSIGPDPLGQKTQVSLQMSKFEATAIGDLAENMLDVIRHAELAFAFLGRLHEDGDHEGHHGFGAMCALCAFGLGSVLAREDEHWIKFAASLRNACVGKAVVA